MIERTDEPYCFRLQKDRVYYVSEKIFAMANMIDRKSVVGLGTCVGKFTHSQKFHVKITFLDFMAPYAKYKVWVKPSQELSFLYGNNILKSGLARITENTPQYQGVVIFSLNDLPIGFGVAARSTAQCRVVDSSEVVVLREADIGEYLREESQMY
ncbi:MAG: 60S ribosome subunit biogenesis protein NIP7 [archaeon]|nr:60S ribosome subunit biogenesis protein NIP7 [archaeon]